MRDVATRAGGAGAGARVTVRVERKTACVEGVTARVLVGRTGAVGAGKGVVGGVAGAVGGGKRVGGGGARALRGWTGAAGGGTVAVGGGARVVVVRVGAVGRGTGAVGGGKGAVGGWTGAVGSRVGVVGRGEGAARGAGSPAATEWRKARSEALRTAAVASRPLLVVAVGAPSTTRSRPCHKYSFQIRVRYPKFVKLEYEGWPPVSS